MTRRRFTATGKAGSRLSVQTSRRWRSACNTASRESLGIKRTGAQAPVLIWRRQTVSVRALVALGMAVLLTWAAPSVGQSPHRDLYMYKGADRDQRVLQGAKKERQAVIYTSLNLKDSVPIAEAFEKKYGVKLELWRSSSEKVLQRALTEARGGRYAVDGFELNGPEMEALRREGLLEEFYSPQFANLPRAAVPKHRQWVADRFNFFTIAYNTNLVKPADVPNSYEDLLNPRWVGEIALEAGDTDWFASMVKSMGEAKGLAFFRKLAQMRPQVRTGHTLMGELVASGEIPLAVSIYNHNAE